MPKNLAIGKRLKIDKAQRTMLGVVAGAALILGVSLVFGVYFLRYIRFNGTVISEKDKAITGYSNAIKVIGVCKAPRGKVYNTSELNSCNPNETDVNDVPNTLRYNVIVNLAQNKDLETVARNGLSICYNSSTGEKLSYDRLYERYRNATTDEMRAYYLEMIGMCSALRVIPDALPSSANALALGASLDKIFKISGYEPRGITPGMSTESELAGLNAIGVSIEVESDSATTMKVLNNIEKSIREINIESARIEISSSGQLRLEATASAYYTEKATLDEYLVTVRGDGRVVRETTVTEGAN